VKRTGEYTDYLQAQGLYDTWVQWASRWEAELPLWHTESMPLPTEAYPDAWVGRRAARWIESYDRSQPFFLWVGFLGPHYPYDAPTDYVQRYRDADQPLEATTAPELPPTGPFRALLEKRLRRVSDEGISNDTLREVRRFYFANVTLIDDAVADIRASLEHAGLLEDTVVVYTADHGEMLGTHGLLSKGVFYDPAVRVPLVLRPPGAIAPMVVNDLVEHVDLTATMLALAGAPPIVHGEGRPLLDHGTHVVPRKGRTVAHSQSAGFAMFATERYKLVVHEHEMLAGQLFDLLEDPHEEHNLVDDPRYACLRQELMALLVVPFLNRATVE
jgi:arylsulfatase A-like enzyme